MAAQVAEIAGGEAAQQVEINDDFTLLNLGGFVRVSQANFLTLILTHPTEATKGEFRYFFDS